jgi:hypothetical protein
MDIVVKESLKFELEYLKKRLLEIEDEFTQDESKIGYLAHACESGKYKGLLLGVVEKLEKVLDK